jgi:cold shock CspA family protein
VRGTISKIIYARGFGFLDDEDDVQRFFHASSVVPGGEFEFLTIGCEVEFEPQDHDKGPRAHAVRRLHE